jgi:hypothetical protein
MDHWNPLKIPMSDEIPAFFLGETKVLFFTKNVHTWIRATGASSACPKAVDSKLAKPARPTISTDGRGNSGDFGTKWRYVMGMFDWDV